MRSLLAIVFPPAKTRTGRRRRTESTPYVMSMLLLAAAILGLAPAGAAFAGPSSPASDRVPQEAAPFPSPRKSTPETPSPYPAPVPVIFTAPPISLGRPPAVIRVLADRTIRWQQDDLTFLDLRGNARIFQGAAFIRAPRLFIRLVATTKKGATSALLAVYGSASTRYQDAPMPPTPRVTSQPRIFHLTTSAGLLITGQTLFGQRPARDAFIERAFACFDAAPGTLIPQALPPDLFGQMRPSAEQMSMTELSDDGVTITLRGNASIRGPDFSLVADTLRLRAAFHGGRFKSPAVRSIYAEGVVRYQRGLQNITARALYLDMTAEEGLALDARVRAATTGRNPNVHFYSGVVRQVSRYRLTCEATAFFTTSEFARPHYRMESRSLHLVRGPASHRLRQRAEMSKRKPSEPGRPQAPEALIAASGNNLLYVKSIPVFYWPYLAHDLHSGMFLLRSLEWGQSSNLGAFVKTQWDLYDLGVIYNDWSKLYLLADCYGGRGTGLGLYFTYEGRDRHGFAKGYYIDDRADEDDRELPNPQSDRGQLTWRHRETDLPWGLQADLELGRLSDRNYLRTYDRADYDEGKDHETILFLRRARANSLLTAQANYRLNSFQNALERQSVAFHLFGEPVPATPLLWTSHTDLSHLQLRFDDDPDRGREPLPTPRPRGDTPESVIRFDTAHELSLPFSAGPLRLDPYVWGNVTSFSRRANEQGADWRTATAAGVRAATNFYRTYDARCALLQIEQLRHIMTPTLHYRYTYAVSDTPADFIQHDAIDALDETGRLSLGVHNRLQTHRLLRGKRTVVDLLTLDLDLVKEISNPAWEGSTEDAVQGNLCWLINQYLTFTSNDNRYNLSLGEIERLEGALTIAVAPPFSISLAQTYYRDRDDASRPDHNITRITLDYRPRYSRWAVEFATAYDFLGDVDPDDTKHEKRLGTSLIFRRHLEDWQLLLGAEFDQGRRSETRLLVRLIPPVGAESASSFR